MNTQHMSRCEQHPKGARTLGRKLMGALVAVAIAWPVAAFAEGGSVRYSYETVEIGGQAERVLVPVGEATMGGKVDADTLQRAFETLKRAKRPTYGKSTIEITGKVPERAKVVVKIDPENARYAIIIIAETVYTLTELGIAGVEFPGNASGVVTRKDVPFAAYTLTVPLWKVLPPGNLSTTQVQMPDGTLEPVAAIYARWKSNSAELRKMVYGYLASDDVFTVITVARLLPTLGSFQPDDVISLLNHSSRPVRRVGLEVLKDQTNNEKVLAAVVKALDGEQDEETARALAAYLGQSRLAPYNVHSHYFLLARGNDEEAPKAAEALASRSGDEQVVLRLAAALEDKREPVSRAALAALGKLNADRARVEAMGSEKVAAPIRTQLAEDVAANSKDAPSRVAALTYLAKNSPEGRSASAIAALGAMNTDESRKVVESFLGDHIAARRLAASQTLLKIGKVESLPAIVAVVRANTDAAAMEEVGYQIMSAQPMATIIEHTTSRDNLIQRLAYRAIGERAVKDGSTDKRTFDTLEAGTKHSDPLIRGAAARALGTLASADSVKVLARMVDDKSPPVRRDVALALGNFKEGELVETLNKYLTDAAPIVISGAIDALEQREDVNAWKPVWSHASHADAGVRSSALKALTTFVDRQDREAVRQVISLLGGAVTDKSETVQVAALSQLGRFNEEMAVTSIAIRVSAEEKYLRLAAVRALGNSGHPSATALVVRALEDNEVDVRRAAIESVGKLKDRSAKPSLQKRVELEKDPELVELIRATLKTI
ncbi:MAG: HEAT repeat domain-containing protein [Bradymonadaceae bacterium]|nr:HEAT repeat domain-containing protein [Lujinxingiaceae bacterium]